MDFSNGRLAIMYSVTFVAMLCIGLAGCDGGRPASSSTNNSAMITDAELGTLIGLTTPELMKRFGKPVSVSTGTRLEDPTIEVWQFYKKVNHEASGVVRSLFCDVKDGKCIKASAL